MARKFKSMDGNNAAAYVSYAFIGEHLPNYPSSPIDYVTSGRPGCKNILVQPSRLSDKSKASAVGAVHGSPGSGALFLTPLLRASHASKHVPRLPSSSGFPRQRVPLYALNIFGDHSDVMSARQTASRRRRQRQEVMDACCSPRSNQDGFICDGFQYFSRDSEGCCLGLR